MDRNTRKRILVGSLVGGYALIALAGSPVMARGTEDEPYCVESKGPASAAAEPAATETPAKKPPQWHRMRMRLSGSLCTACLYDLMRVMNNRPGVTEFKAKPARGVYMSGVSPDIGGWADAVAIYDAAKTTAVEVRYAIKTHGYHSYKVVDEALKHEPTAKDVTLR